MNPASHRPRAASSLLRILTRGVLLLAAVAVGVAAGGLVTAAAGRAMGDGLDLGQIRDRAAFTVALGVTGAVGGGGLGLWLALRTFVTPWSLARMLAGLVAALGASATAILAFSFVMTTPPPPVQPFLVTEIRLAPDDSRALTFGAYSGRALWSEVAKAKRTEPGGDKIISAVFPMASRAGVDHVAIHHDGREVGRFSLGLPSDPPATASFSPWIAPDRWQGSEAGEGPSAVEMRFRIERRVVR